MANNYEKLTLSTFQKKLKAKGYKNLTGARRAIGKTQDLSNIDKDKARRMADRFFGAPPAAKPAKKTKVKAKKKTETRNPVTKKAVRKAKAKVAKKAAAKKPAKPKAAKPKAAKPARTPVTTRPKRLENMSASEIRRSPAAAANLAISIMGPVSEAITAMKNAGIIDDPDVQNEVKEGVKTLGKAVRLIDQRVVSPLTDPSGNGAVQAPADEAKAIRILRETQPTPPAPATPTEGTGEPS